MSVMIRFYFHPTPNLAKVSLFSAHLRLIHPMTRERKVALIEEARAARRAEQRTMERQEPEGSTEPD
jgi:hypothetical protein